jgi:hypothetical protein
MMLFLATGTRPDIAHAISEAAKKVEKPTKEDWNTLMLIACYLQGTKDLGLVYKADENRELYGYSDTNWGNGSLDARSTTGYVFMLAGGAIAWKSQQQGKIAMATQEVETYTFVEVVEDGLWLLDLLHHIGHEQKTVTIRCDNNACITLMENGKINKRNRTIIMHCCKILEHCWETKEIRAEYVNTQQQAADLFTKGLPWPQFERCRELMGMTNTSQGGVLESHVRV